MSGHVAFVGLGNMGLPMLRNLVKAGHAVRAFDLSAAALAAAAGSGATVAASAADAAGGAAAVVTALPAARHVKGAYLGEGGLIAAAPEGAILIDCSTIDVDSARAVAAEAAAQGRMMVDSPMSGGVGGAAAGTLTFMVGGPDAAFAAARPYLSAMGRNVFHAGASGAGAAAKIINNMMLSAQMIAVAEGFNLASRLGVDHQKLWEIASTATARCWALNDYCPAPGPAPAAPSNRDYAPGFAAELMLKDLRIAMETAQAAGAVTPIAGVATQLYGMMVAAGQGGQDFSGIIRYLDPDAAAPARKA
jgi:3-hydroxyisobutyrate dehydrogenase